MLFLVYHHLLWGLASRLNLISSICCIPPIASSFVVGGAVFFMIMLSSVPLPTQNAQLHSSSSIAIDIYPLSLFKVRKGRIHVVCYRLYGLSTPSKLISKCLVLPSTSNSAIASPVAGPFRIPQHPCPEAMNAPLTPGRSQLLVYHHLSWVDSMIVRCGEG